MSEPVNDDNNGKNGHENQPCAPDEFESYKLSMIELNQSYAVTMVGSECCVIEKHYDPVRKDYDVRFLSFAALKNKLLNRKIINPWRTQNQGKYKDVGSMWLSSGFRKEYSGVVFDPSNRVDPKYYYNLFRGFPFEPRPGDWSLLKAHIGDIICAGNHDITHYVMGWMARIIQDPGGNRPGTALVFKGVQGCGKGTVINALGKLVGSHYRHILHLSHLTGRFNHHLKDALLVFCDEVLWGGDKQAEGILKGLITEPTVPIEPKGKDMMEMDSHINVAIASNNDWVVPAGLEERRFCVLKVLPDKVGDRQYFNDMYLQMNTGGYNAMMYDLLNYDHSDLDLRTIPRTPELFEQILNSMSPVHKFWHQCLSDGKLMRVDLGWTGGVNAYNFHSEYRDFCDSIGIRHKLIRNQFARKLKEMCPYMEKSRPREATGDQTLEYDFPPLDVCRELFSKVINLGVEW